MTILPRRVLVFPGTTLVGLEILRSLESLPGFTVHGAGIDVLAGREAGYAKYDYLPFVDQGDFASELRALVARDAIDYVYPANDLAIAALAELGALGATLVSHAAQTVRIAGSKIATHSAFADDGVTPERFVDVPADASFPVFSKPDIGHSSIGAKVLPDRRALVELVEAEDDFWLTHLVTEVLVTDEVTVDCFSTATQGLLYAAPRTRDIAEGGVSVVTTDYHDDELTRLATLVDDKLSFNGPWFLQAKRGNDGRFRLMEIGARLAGASGMRRAQGVNLAHLAILAAEGLPLSVYTAEFDFVSRRTGNNPEVESGEAFNALYIDLDDTLILNGRINEPVAQLARHVKSLGIYVAIITRHRLDPVATLEYFGLSGLFDDVFHATNGEPKASYVKDDGYSVLVDDSFSERIASRSKRHILAVDASGANLLRRLFDGGR